MLEHATNEEIVRLISAQGKAVDHVNLREIPVGSLVKLQTASENIYLLETIDTEQSLAHVVRHSPHTKTQLTGYLGERVITPSIIYKGETMSHNEFTTRPIILLELLSS